VTVKVTSNLLLNSILLFQRDFGFCECIQENYKQSTWNSLQRARSFYRFIFRIRFRGPDSNPDWKAKYMEQPTRAALNELRYLACLHVAKKTKRNKVNYEVLTRNSCENSIKQTSYNCDHSSRSRLNIKNQKKKLFDVDYFVSFRLL
jgi:hypothetical protein